MNFFKKIFNPPKDKKPEEPNSEFKDLPLDQIFVKKFINNNGKFL